MPAGPAGARRPLRSRDRALPVCADQSVHTLSDIVEQSDNGAVGIALKLNKLGGFGACLRAASICEERGLKIVSSARQRVGSHLKPEPAPRRADVG